MIIGTVFIRFLPGFISINFNSVIILSLVVMFVSIKSNNGWGVAVGLFLLLISPFCDEN